MSQPELIESLQARLKSESHSGKHARYQVLPSELSVLLGGDAHAPSSRYERQRFDFIREHVEFKGKTVVDIGCNMGFFTFSALSEGAENVTCYEGTMAHAEFVNDCGELLQIQNKLSVHPCYFEFTHEPLNVDVAILLNVLHHFGDDYGDAKASIEQAKKEIITQLNSMRHKCQKLIFQLGFNWRGDRELPLFIHGTKKELIDYIMDNTESDWDVQQIGIAVKDSAGVIAYKLLNSDNIHRVDELGEFLNRPIFIMKAKG